MHIPEAERKFWSKVRIDKYYQCWEWTGNCSAGYGRVQYEGKMWGAHRLAYTLARGPIPEGLQVGHLCGNRKCCNPDHLHAVDQSENERDKHRVRKTGNGQLALPI